jgi:poly(hydroxyalkanoate) granule-associated protein
MASSKDTLKKTTPKADAAGSAAPPVQHVWLAGLGALAKAQQEGSKAIEALVNDGLAFQRKSQSEAQQRLQEASERLSHLASDFGQPASGRVDKLEHLFEDRVAKALHRLGMPSLLDIQMLNDRVAQLEAQLAALNGTAKVPTQPAKPRQSQAAAKSAPKPAVKSVGKKAIPTGGQASPKTASVNAQKPRHRSA